MENERKMQCCFGLKLLRRIQGIHNVALGIILEEEKRLWLMGTTQIGINQNLVTLSAGWRNP